MPGEDFWKKEKEKKKKHKKTTFLLSPQQEKGSISSFSWWKIYIIYLILSAQKVQNILKGFEYVPRKEYF